MSRINGTKTNSTKDHVRKRSVSPNDTKEATTPLKKRGRANTPNKVGKSDEQLRKEAEGWVSTMPILLTGIPSVPVTLVGISPATKGAVLQYMEPIVGPRKWFLERLAKYPDLESRFLAKCVASIPFYSTMTTAQCKEWLYSHAFSQELDLVELAASNTDTKSPASAYIVQTGDAKKCKLAQLDDDQLGEWASTKQPVLLSDIKKAIVDATETKSLFFLPNFWQIQVIEHGAVPTDFKGYQVELHKDILQSYSATTGSASTNRWCVRSNLVVSEAKTDSRLSPLVSDSEMNKALVSAWLTHDPLRTSQKAQNSILEARGAVRQWLKGLGAAFHKSLFQKIIRFQALTIVSPCESQTYDTDAVLLAVMAELALHPGGLTPNVKRWVTGLESLFKRLAVITPEDAYVDDAKDLTFLQSCAAVAKRVPSWKPSATHMVRTFCLGLRAVAERRCMTYSTHHTLPPYDAKDGQSAWKTASFLMDSVGGMDGDKKMYRDLARRHSGESHVDAKQQPVSNRPAKMNVLHMIDQHCAASLVYFIPYSVVVEYSRSNDGAATAAFGPILDRVFRQLSGLNPRRHTIDLTNGLVKHIIHAQQRYWAAIHRHEAPYKSLICIESKSNSTYDLVRTLPNDWLASGVGILRPPTHRTLLVTLRTNDPDEMVVIRNPTRGPSTDTGTLSQETKDAARNSALQMVRRGIGWTGHTPCPEWTGATLTLRSSSSSSSSSASSSSLSVPKEDESWEYWLRLKDEKGMGRPWNQAKELRIPVPVLPSPAPVSHPVDWLASHTNGMLHDAYARLDKWLTTSSESVMRRALHYIGNYQSQISLPRVARNGGAIKDAVAMEDAAVFQFMLCLCQWFPSALVYTCKPRNTSPLDFTVKLGPLMWEIADRVRSFVQTLTVRTGSDEKKRVSKWPALKDTMMVNGKLRQPWEHQIDAVAQFWMRKRDMKRGNILDVPPGKGKTRIVCEYVAQQIQQGVMPDYMIYTLPPEGMESNVAEWTAYGATVRILDPHKTSILRKNPKLQRYIQPIDAVPVPFTVTLVAHDGLRLLSTILTGPILSHAFFVVDESHKTLNDSKRTTISREYSNASREFLLMTGTLVNRRYEQLIPALTQISSIPVTRKNFWVAMNGVMIHHIDDSVPTVRETVYTELNAEELKGFQDNMPIGMGGKNSMADRETVRRGLAFAERACDRGCVDTIVNVLKDEKEPGVMLIANNTAHAATLKSLLLKTTKFTAPQLLVLGTDVHTINMTASNAKDSSCHPHVRVVIVPLRMSTSYNLSRFRILVTQVYPSSFSTREQLEKRENRGGQTFPEMIVKTVVDSTGFFAMSLTEHEYPRTLNEIINQAFASNTGVARR